MEFDEVSSKIIKCALEVHKELGPGLMESVYHRALQWEFDADHIRYSTEVELPIIYKGHPLPGNYRLDLFVEGCVVVEIKAVERILPVHLAQTLTYMKLINSKIGLLLNFNDSRLLIKRLVL